jgi:hypothetical protein
MLICEFCRGLVLASVVVAMVISRLTVAQLIVAAVVEQVFQVFSTLAERRLTQALVDRDDAASALAQTEGRTHMAVMVGRPLGALLFGISHALPFIADSFTFFVSVGALLRIRRHQPHGSIARAEKSSLTQEIFAGWQWIWRHEFARVAVPLTAGTTLIGQGLIMVFLGEAHAAHLSALVIGLILAASGGGGLLGSAIAPLMFRVFQFSLLKAQLTAWLFVLAGLAYFGGRSLVGVAVAMTLLSLTGALGNIEVDTYILREAGPTILARVMSVSWLIAISLLALGPLLGGILLGEFGVRGAIIWLFMITLVFGACAQWMPSANASQEGVSARLMRRLRSSLTWYQSRSAAHRAGQTQTGAGAEDASLDRSEPHPVTGR